MDANHSAVVTSLSLSFSASDATFNRGRQLAYESFTTTLGALFGRTDVSELDFRDEWLRRMRSHDGISRNGWYEPPPQGMAVLFATDEKPGRISFDSLRHETAWPSAATMDWHRGLLYAYCSPVDLQSALPGDFAVTLYFGESTSIRKHFTNAHAATRTILAQLATERSAASLFSYSQDVFAEAGLRNAVVSVTDSVLLDLGHSLPLLTAVSDGALNDAAREQLRDDRRFISKSSDWTLSDADQLTIEPQLVSARDTTFPQVSFHYAAAYTDTGVVILSQNDTLLREYGLLS